MLPCFFYPKLGEIVEEKQMQQGTLLLLRRKRESRWDDLWEKI